ncbi:MAG: hypothetical protein ACYTEV_05170 [Planctomycetota bacterium]
MPTPTSRPWSRLAASGLATAITLIAGCGDPTDDGSGYSAPEPETAAPAPAPAAIDARSGGGTTATPGASPAAPDLPAPSGEGRSTDEHPRVASFAGLRGPKPATWQWQSPRPMRAGNWTIPGRNGGDFAELTAFVGIGGGVEANLTRWVGQFRSPEMRMVEPERWELDVPGLGSTAAMIQIVGEFAGMTGTYRPGQALLGAVLESPVGPVQLKLTGPEEVVLGVREQFEAMVAGLAPRAEYPLPPADAGDADAGS